MVDSSSYRIEPTGVTRTVIGRGSDSWICANGADFSTLTFGGVDEIFRSSIVDVTQTALVVNRVICHVREPTHFRFSDGAMRVLTDENAGGASEFSEAVSFEIFHRAFDAALAQTEMAIEYKWGPWSKKTDMVVLMCERKIAVSVTRAMKFHGTFSQEDAFNLLYKKLLGVSVSNRHVVACDRWEKQVLHIMTEHVHIVDLLRSAYSWIYAHTPELIGNTVVLISLTVNTPFLYYNFCAEQSEMVFTHNRPIDTCERTFTTDAKNDHKDGKAMRESSTQQQEEEEFFYGFPTKSAAILHGALPIKYEEILEEEGSVSSETQKEIGVGLGIGISRKEISGGEAKIAGLPLGLIRVGLHSDHSPSHLSKSDPLGEKRRDPHGSTSAILHADYPSHTHIETASLISTPPSSVLGGPIVESQSCDPALIIAFLDLEILAISCWLIQAISTTATVAVSISIVADLAA